MAQTQHKKKILYVITKAGWGGAGTYVYDLATNISSEENNVAVVLGSSGTLKDLLEKRGIRTHSVHAFQRNVSFFLDFSAFWQLFKLFRAERPDIVHLNSSKIGGLGSLAGRFARVPKIVFTVHGWPFNEERGWIERFFIRIFSYTTMVLCHHLIVISKKDYRQALSFPFVKSKVIFIPNGIRHPSFLAREAARRLLVRSTNLSSKDTEKLWIGMIGELHANKGYIYALRAVERLRDAGTNIALIIIGRGEEKLSLMQYIERQKLGDYVFLVGDTFDGIGPSEGSILMKAFDVFLLTSVKEGLPYNILEAGAASLPVVASSVGGVPDIIVDMKSGMLVRKQDEKEIADAISYLCKDIEKRHEFGKRLNDIIASDFSLYRMVNKTSEVYGTQLTHAKLQMKQH